MAPSHCQLAQHVEFLQEKTNHWLNKDDFASRRAMRDAALRLAHSLEEPFEISDRLMYEPITAMCLNVALDGKWFEYLIKHEGPVSAVELCQECGGSPAFMVRIMRLLVLHGMVDEHDVEVYRANDATRYMLEKAIFDNTQHIYPLHAQAYTQIPRWAKENGYQEPKSLENGAFYSRFGKTIWQTLEEDPVANAAFTHSMDWFYQGPATNQDLEFLHADITQHAGSKDAAVTIVDIGGGSGGFIKEFLNKFPETQGRLITQDRSSVNEVGRKHSCPTGIEFIAHDFFTPQPVKGAHGYSMRHIIHDWPDEPALKILQNTAVSMEKHSRFYIFDLIVPDKGYTEAAVMMDLLMMASFSGKERTQRQWEELLAAAGLKLVDAVVFDPISALGVIVAALAD